MAGAGFTALIYGVDALRAAAPGLTGPVTLVALLGLYVGLVAVAARRPDLEVDDPNAEKIVLPTVKEVYATGLHYILAHRRAGLVPDGRTPKPGEIGLLRHVADAVHHRHPAPAEGVMRGQGAALASEFMAGLVDLREGLIAGAAQHDRHRRGDGGGRDHRGDRSPRPDPAPNWPRWSNSCRAAS